MATIKIKLSSNRSFVSRIIRLFTWAKYSHVDYAFTDGTFLSAHPCGVMFKKLRYDIEDCYELEVSDKRKIEQFLHNQLCKPYDWRAVFGLPFKRNWQEEDKWFCFELIAAAIEQSDDVFDKDAARITAKDFYNNPKFKKIEV